MNFFIYPLLLALPIALAGCSSIQVTARDIYSSQPAKEEDEIRYSMAAVSRTPEQEQKISRAVASKDLVLGMSMAEVQHAWGQPTDIESAGHSRHGNERWIYRSGLSSRYGLGGETRAVYFESGRVVGWQSE
jgi:hypothetical protein